MSEENVIEIENLSKHYKLYGTPADRLREALHYRGKSYHRDFFALDSVSLNVKRGECVGLIGMNGSGKSTLLQIIAGVLHPSSGTLKVTGQISALLELGAGFNPEFNGVENIKFQCSIMGIADDKVSALISEILKFAEIGDFAYQPVKTYSSGMYVRLAFAVAINIDPDILIVDEALAVGDAYFQAKCMRKIREFRAAGKTLLFVSHDPGAVKSLCDRAYLLHRGKLIHKGNPAEVFNFYNNLIAMKEENPEVSDVDKALHAALKTRSGNQKIQIIDVAMLNQEDRKTDIFTSGEQVKISIEFEMHQNIENPTVGILIRDRLGNDIFGTNTHLLSKDIGLCRSGTRRTIDFKMPLNLGAHIYSLTVAIHTDDTHVHESFDWINDALVFRVIQSPDEKFSGFCRLNPEIQFTA